MVVRWVGVGRGAADLDGITDAGTPAKDVSSRMDLPSVNSRKVHTSASRSKDVDEITTGESESHSPPQKAGSLGRVHSRMLRIGGSDKVSDTVCKLAWNPTIWVPITLVGHRNPPVAASYHTNGFGTA